MPAGAGSFIKKELINKLWMNGELKYINETKRQKTLNKLNIDVIVTLQIYCVAYQ